MTKEDHINTEATETNDSVLENNEQATQQVEEVVAETVEVHTEPQNNAELDKVKAELAEMKDKYLRLYADFENFRRRTAKEKIEMTKSAGEDTIVALLPVLDDFERAVKNMPATSPELESIKVGVELVHQKFAKTLEQKGLKRFKSVGEVFNLELHEAITQFPAPSEDMKGKVVDEIESGYYLGDKVIRFAKVVVGN